MFIIRFKLQKIKKILPIVFFSKNLDPIFYRSTINVLNYIGQNNMIINNQKFNRIYKSPISIFYNNFLYIYLNILSPTILSTHAENILFKTNKEVYIYSKNRHKFPSSKLILIKKELKFQLQKELYYNEKQEFISIKTHKFYEKFYNIKYL